ncbi:iron-containing alcohol dehydrogenase [Parashewanella hymeniacidonis]|uniref:iron-containing alcohol dehydrogenase n=1 Tax=Parashewanella hymeniacidonis TaxID=2807618 RepID=UPI003B8464F1
MQNLEFYNPTRIFFGKGQIEQLDALVPSGAKVMISLGGNSAQATGTLDEVVAALKQRDVVEFNGIEPHKIGLHI